MFVHSQAQDVSHFYQQIPALRAERLLLLIKCKCIRAVALFGQYRWGMVAWVDGTIPVFAPGGRDACVVNFARGGGFLPKIRNNVRLLPWELKGEMVPEFS